jgi:hypothetical protein
METIVAVACLGGGLVAMVVTLVLTMHLQARTPDADETMPANERPSHMPDH